MNGLPFLHQTSIVPRLVWLENLHNLVLLTMALQSKIIHHQVDVRQGIKGKVRKPGTVTARIPPSAPLRMQHDLLGDLVISLSHSVELSVQERCDPKTLHCREDGRADGRDHASKGQVPLRDLGRRNNESVQS